jgi:hypothetical protein
VHARLPTPMQGMFPRHMKFEGRAAMATA